MLLLRHLYCLLSKGACMYTSSFFRLSTYDASLTPSQQLASLNPAPLDLSFDPQQQQHPTLISLIVVKMVSSA